MTKATFSLNRANEPVALALIGVHPRRAQELRQAGQLVPAARTVRALLDTRAAVSCLDPAVAQPLQLPPCGSRQILGIETGGGGYWANLFQAGVRIPFVSGNPADDCFVPRHAVVQLPLSHLGYEVILRVDFLIRCIFTLNGPARLFTLEH